MTDRFTKAVEQLGADKLVKRQKRNKAGTLLFEDGSDGNPDFKKPIYEEISVPNIEVRLGGMLSLERISRDSIRFHDGQDHIRAMKALCAYIRHNSPLEDAQDVGDGILDKVENPSDRGQFENFSDIFKIVRKIAPLREDVAFALSIIRGRDSPQIACEKMSGYVLDLANTNLQRANLEGADLSGANFFRGRLEGAYLNDCNLTDANLNCARLAGASAVSANFSTSRLHHTDFSASLLDDAIFIRSDFSFTHFQYSQLKRAFFDVYLKHGTVNAIHFIEPNFMETRISGDIPSGAIVHYRREKSSHSAGSGTVVFRNARVDPVLIDGLGARRTFGDGTVVLRPQCVLGVAVGPSEAKPPSHWPKEALNTDQFKREFRKWKESPDTY